MNKRFCLWFALFVAAVTITATSLFVMGLAEAGAPGISAASEVVSFALFWCGLAGILYTSSQLSRTRVDVSDDFYRWMRSSAMGDALVRGFGGAEPSPDLVRIVAVLDEKFGGVDAIQESPIEATVFFRSRKPVGDSHPAVFILRLKRRNGAWCQLLSDLSVPLYVALRDLGVAD